MSIHLPVIETARLRLRTMRPEDVSSIHSIWSDPEVMKYIPVVLFRTPEEIGEFIALSLQRWEERGFGIFAVTIKENDELVGYCGLQYLDGTPEVEIYYGLSKVSWNRGIATEAARAVIKFGFEQVKLENIAGVTLPDNVASQKVLEKIGLEKREVSKRFYNTECVYFAAAREDYLPDEKAYRLIYE